jgi:hypothetical protein
VNRPHKQYFPLHVEIVILLGSKAAALSMKRSDFVEGSPSAASKIETGAHWGPHGPTPQLNNFRLRMTGSVIMNLTTSSDSLLCIYALEPIYLFESLI